jgi:predicted nucleotidyltransferase
MLTHERIVEAVRKAASEFYPIAKAEYFGSYANECATEDSDLDLLVDFGEKTVSILTVIGFKHFLEDELEKPVDVISMPIPKEAIIEIGRTVSVYD